MSTTTQEFRDGIMRWFRLHTKEYAGGWVPVTAFIEAWSSRLSPGQGTYDLRKLIEAGELEKRVDYSKQERRGSGYAAMTAYRVVHLVEAIEPGIETFQLDPPKEAITWTCREYSGTEIFAAPEGMPYEDVVAHKDGFALKPVTTREGIHDGSIIIVQDLFGFGIYIVETTQVGLVGISKSKAMMAVLKFDTDDRHCWTCCGTANLKAIQKLDIYKEGKE
jgi:hypothetical protein